MPKGSPIYNPDVQSDIDMKNTWKLVNYTGSGNTLISSAQTIYVDGVNGTSSGQRGTTSAFQTLSQALAVAQQGDHIVWRGGTYASTANVTISVNSLTIDAWGVKLVSSSPTNTTKLTITGSDIIINGLEIDCVGTPLRTLTDVVLNSTTTITSATGAFTNSDVNGRVTFRNQKNAFAGNYIASVTNSTTALLNTSAGATKTGVNMEIWAADPNAGAIEVSGARCQLNFLYVHDYISHLIRLSAGSDGFVASRCRLENGVNGIVGTNNSANPIHDIQIVGCIAKRCRYDSFRLSTEGYTGTGASYRGVIIAGNISHDCCSFGVELFGSVAAEGAQVYGNYLENNGLGGISMASTTQSSASGNAIVGFYGLGIEFAESITNSYNLCSNNIIGEANEDGTIQDAWSSGVRGISVSDNQVFPSNNTIKLLIQGNSIIVPNGLGMNINDVKGVSCRNNYTKTGSSAYSLLSPVSDISIEGSFSELLNSTTYGVFFDTTGQTSTGFHFTNNRFVRLDGTTGYPIYQSYSTGGAQVINDVVIEGTRTNMTFGGSGFVADTGGNTVNKTLRNNLPSGSIYSAGFQDAVFAYGGITTGGLDFNINDAGTPDSTAARVLSSGGNLYLQYGSGGHIYMRKTDGTILATWSSTGLDSPGLSVAGNAVETINHKNAASGYCPLDGSAKVPAANLPTLSSGTIASTLLPLAGDNSGNAVAASVSGSGAVVLVTGATLVTPTLGVATATSLDKWIFTAPATAATLTAGADSLTYTMPEITTKIGFRHIPQNSQSAAYTTVLNDSGKHIYHPASDANARTFTIDSNANVAYPIGTAITFANLSANTVTIAITSDTMYLAGAGTTGNRSLAQYGTATALKTNTTEWVIQGVGLS